MGSPTFGRLPERRRLARRAARRVARATRARPARRWLFVSRAQADGLEVRAGHRDRAGLLEAIPREREVAEVAPQRVAVGSRRLERFQGWAVVRRKGLDEAIRRGEAERERPSAVRPDDARPEELVDVLLGAPQHR